MEYSIRVSLATGSLASDVHVILPIRIINFLSVDPPPSFPIVSHDGHLSHNSIFGPGHDPALGRHRSRPVIEGLFPHEEDDHSSFRDLLLRFDGQSSPPASVLELLPTSELDPELLHTSRSSDSLEIGNDAYDAIRSHAMIDDELGDLALGDDSEDGTNDVWIPMNGYEQEKHAARFADLYYASIEHFEPIANIQLNSKVELAADSPDSQATPRVEDSSQLGTGVSTLPRHHAAPCPEKQIEGLKRPGPSPFTLRVQEKLQAIGRTGPSSGSATVGQTQDGEELHSSPKQEIASESIHSLCHTAAGVGPELPRAWSISEWTALHLEPAIDHEGCFTAPKARPLLDAPRMPLVGSLDSNQQVSSGYLLASIMPAGPESHTSKTGWTISGELSHLPDLPVTRIVTPCDDREPAARPGKVGSCSDMGRDKPMPCHLPTTESDLPLAKTSAINSVKARIKELEDRARAAGGGLGPG